MWFEMTQDPDTIVRTLQKIHKTLRMSVSPSRFGTEIVYFGDSDIYQSAVLFRGNKAFAVIVGFLDYQEFHEFLLSSEKLIAQIDDLPDIKLHVSA